MEDARIERLERRVNRLEDKNEERSMFWLHVWMYGIVAAAWIMALVVIATHASNS